jgi:hypothetical protein
MRLEDPSLLDSLESRFSFDFQQIVIDFVVTFCRHPWLVTFCTFQAVICTFQSVIGPLKSRPEAGAVGGRPFSRLGSQPRPRCVSPATEEIILRCIAEVQGMSWSRSWRKANDLHDEP